MINQISYSSLKNFVECPYSMYLEKIKGEEIENYNLYTVLGGLVHKIIEEELLKEEAKEKFSGELKELLKDKKYSFIKSKPSLNEKIKDNYEKNILLFFNNFKKIECKKRHKETFFTLPINDFILRGVIDEIAEKENGEYIIIDYKTSSLKEEISDLEKNQLLIYAWYLNMQLNIPFDKIKCCYNFIKYCKVRITETDKEYICERKDLIKEISSFIKEEIRKKYKDMEEYEIDLAIAYYSNGVENKLIEEIIKQKIIIEDYYHYIDVNDLEMSRCLDFIKNKMEIIMSKSEQEKDWERNKLKYNEIFKCENFCNVSKHCKYLEEYKNNKNNF